LLAEALKENNSLTSLDIESNNIGVEGARLLAEALKESNSLTSLEIGWNNIGHAMKDVIETIMLKENVLKRKGWNPNNHCEWKDDNKEIVETLMLIRALDDNILSIMPNEIMYIIIRLSM
jgi:hypothetical protein